MPTTIRVYIDGGVTPYATGTMNADRTFSVPVAGLANGSHTVEVTAQEDGKGESPRAIQTITVDRGTGVVHALAGDVVLAAAADGDLTASGAPTQHALAASITVSGTVTADLTLAFMALYGDASASVTTGADLTAGSGVGAALIPADPTFALTTAFPTTAATGAWWKSEQPATVDVDPPGTASVTRGVTAPAWFTGSTKVAKLSAQAGLGYDYNPVTSLSFLSYRFARATIDAGSLITFDFGSNAPSLNLTRLDVEVLNGSGTSIIDKTTQRNSLLLYAGSWGTADGTTIAKPLTTSTKQTATFDLKTWANARLLGGNSWDIDAATVTVTFIDGSDSDASETSLYLGNFR